MNLKLKESSAELVNKISKRVPTFHHHYHILMDIADTYFFNNNMIYAEIGAYSGGSASLMVSRPKTKVISIDIGDPISPEIAINNVNYYNFNNNFYKYIHGNSKEYSTVNELAEVLNGEKIDILFIDGDHFYNAVVSDFYEYKHLVNSNGFIVFDDYQDHIYSPDVKPAVDMIVSNLSENDYEIIGSLKNTCNAYPSEIEYNNCFVIRKL